MDLGAPGGRNNPFGTTGGTTLKRPSHSRMGRRGLGGRGLFAVHAAQSVTSARSFVRSFAIALNSFVL